MAMIYDLRLAEFISASLVLKDPEINSG